MNELILTGWRGQNPLHVLASFGVLAQLEDAGVPAKLGWRPGLWEPVVACQLEGADALAECLAAGLTRWRRGGDLAPTLRLGREKAADAPEIRIPATEVRELLQNAGGPALELLCGFFSETRLHSDGERVQATSFHHLAGRMQFLKIARNLAKTLDAATFAESFESDLARDVSNSEFLWDAVEGATHAYRAVAPTAAPNRVDPAANWCAMQGLRLLPCVPRIGDQRVAGAVPRPQRKKSWTWPLWSGLLDRPTVQSLMASFDPQRPKAARARGVVGFLRARVVSAGKNQGFTPPQWLAETLS